MVGGVVCGGSLARAWGAAGGGHAHLMKATQHVGLHLEGHGGPAAVLVHQLHGGGVVVHLVGDGRRVLGVQLHVRQRRDPRRRRGLEGVTRRWRRRQMRRVRGHCGMHGGPEVLRGIGNGRGRRRGLRRLGWYGRLGRGGGGTCRGLVAGGYGRLSFVIRDLHVFSRRMRGRLKDTSVLGLN